MGMSERAVHINNLVALKDFCNNNGVFTLASNIEQSLDYAISSLKTDEAYQIMYEGGEIFTKADMVAMLEEISLKMDKVSFTRSNDFGVYARTPAEIRKDYSDIIQEKIKAIEGNEDGK